MRSELFVTLFVWFIVVNSEVVEDIDDVAEVLVEVPGSTVVDTVVVSEDVSVVEVLLAVDLGIVVKLFVVVGAVVDEEVDWADVVEDIDDVDFFVDVVDLVVEVEDVDVMIFGCPLECPRGCTCILYHAVVFTTVMLKHPNIPGAILNNACSDL